METDIEMKGKQFAHFRIMLIFSRGKSIFLTSFICMFIFTHTLMVVATTTVAVCGRDGVGHSGTSNTDPANTVVSTSLPESTMQSTNQPPSDMYQTSSFAAPPLHHCNTTAADEGASDKVDL